MRNSLGELLIRCKNKDLFYLLLLIPGVIGLIALSLNLGLRFPNYVTYYYGGNFYRMGILNTLITLMFDCLLLSIWHFIGKILPTLFKRPLFFLSKNINVFYVLTWFEISAVIHIQAEYGVEFPLIALFGIMVAVLVSCALSVYPIKALIRLMRKKPSETA